MNAIEILLINHKNDQQGQKKNNEMHHALRYRFRLRGRNHCPSFVSRFLETPG